VFDRWKARRRDGGEERTLTARSFWPPVQAGAIGPENALGVGDAYACVRALSDAASSLPLHVYRRTAQGRERLDNRTQELLERPSPGSTQAGLVGQMVAHLNLFGNCFVGKYRDSAGRVVQLALLPPDRVQVELKRGEIVFTVHNTNGAATRHGFEDIVHVKALTTDGLVGLSPVRQARKTLELSRSLSEYARNFIEADATPPGILKLGNATPTQIEEIRNGWNARHKSPEQAGRIAIVAGEVDWINVGMPADDMQFLEQRKLSATEVARIFRVPPWVIGAEDGGSMTYSNVEMQSLHFATYSLRPWLVLIEQALSNDRDLFQRNTFCEFKLDALLRSDSKTRAEVYRMALDPITGWMSRDEVRRLENLEPELAASGAVVPEPAEPERTLVA
jgi:HK97 family phage portal protein